MTGAEDRTLSELDGPSSLDIEADAPHLVLALEAARPLTPPFRISLAGVTELSLRRGSARARRSNGAGRVTAFVPDGLMSARGHALIRASGGVFFAEDAGSKNGTFRNGERISSAPLADGDVLETGGSFFLFRRGLSSERPPSLPRGELAKGAPLALSTMSAELERRLSALEAVAPSTVPVAISGETGTGKEVAARAVHEQSGRSGRFQAVNCGAIPAELVESELFGSRRGAFSGAIDRHGHVRAASGGTLFLDEVSELPAPAQAALLRVLQEREVVPVGDTRPVPVDLRVIAASQRPLVDLVREERFRADLYARLAGLEIELLPLRRRLEDLGLIAGALLRRAGGARAEAAGFRRSAARALFRYSWPWNIRELEQALASALALGRGRPIGLADLPPPLREASDPDRSLSERDRAHKRALAEALAEGGGNISEAARRLGKARTQIRRWCRRFDLDPAKFRR